MKKEKIKCKWMIHLAITILLAPHTVFADETVSEKASVVGNNVKRATKKGMHRTEEAFCTKGDVSCTTRKARNRATEAQDANGDKVKEVKNKID